MSYTYVVLKGKVLNIYVIVILNHKTSSCFFLRSRIDRVNLVLRHSVGPIFATLILIFARNKNNLKTKSYIGSYYKPDRV